MNRAQREKALEYLNECRLALGLPPIHLSRAHASPGAIAEFRPTRRGLTLYLSRQWWKESPAMKREYFAHELLHAKESDKSRLVDRWLEQKRITKRQHNIYVSREEAHVYALQAAVARLLPEWED